jgi:hypothetical protein
MQGAILMGAIKEIVYANRYSATPSKLYVHKFGAGVGVYALRDGTIAIRGKRRLWDTFSVGDSE